MAEVRDQIFEKLKMIENENFLNHILDLVQNVDKEGIYQLSEKHKSEIDESIEQIQKGEFFTHEEVMKSLSK